MPKLGEITVHPEVTNAEEFAQAVSDILGRAFDELAGIGLRVEFVTRDSGDTPDRTRDTRPSRQTDET